MSTGRRCSTVCARTKYMTSTLLWPSRRSLHPLSVVDPRFDPYCPPPPPEPSKAATHGLPPLDARFERASIDGEKFELDELDYRQRIVVRPIVGVARAQQSWQTA
ncbi:hypothetical protein U1Q18_035306 [Sarracenia purpurea var. burkii]